MAPRNQIRQRAGNGRGWWAVRGSNSRHPVCKFYPTDNGQCGPVRFGAAFQELRGLRYRRHPALYWPVSNSLGPTLGPTPAQTKSVSHDSPRLNYPLRGSNRASERSQRRIAAALSSARQLRISRQKSGFMQIDPCVARPTNLQGRPHFLLCRSRVSKVFADRFRALLLFASVM